MNLEITEERYRLVDGFEDSVTHINFPAGVWNIAAKLAKLNKPASILELEKLTEQSSDQIREAIEKLVAQKLVQPNLISWKDFVAAINTTQGEPAIGVQEAAKPSGKPSGPEFVPAEKVIDSKGGFSLVSPAVNGSESQETAGVRLGTISSRSPTTSQNSGWVWKKPDAAMVAGPAPEIPTALPNAKHFIGRPLRPLLSKIEKLRGGVEGQLQVYEVFLRVPHQLLHAEGIKSLHLVDEQTVIQTPALHAAILNAAREVTGVDLS